MIILQWFDENKTMEKPAMSYWRYDQNSTRSYAIVNKFINSLNHENIWTSINLYTLKRVNLYIKLSKKKRVNLYILDVYVYVFTLTKIKRNGNYYNGCFSDLISFWIFIYGFLWTQNWDIIMTNRMGEGKSQPSCGVVEVCGGIY